MISGQSCTSDLMRNLKFESEKLSNTHLQKCYRIAVEKCNEAYDTRFSHGQEFSLGFFDAARLRFCLNTLYLKLLFTKLEVLKLNAG